MELIVIIRIIVAGKYEASSIFIFYLFIEFFYLST